MQKIYTAFPKVKLKKQRAVFAARFSFYELFVFCLFFDNFSWLFMIFILKCRSHGRRDFEKKHFAKVNLILSHSPSVLLRNPPPSRREAFKYEALKIICIPDKQALYH